MLTNLAYGGAEAGTELTSGVSNATDWGPPNRRWVNPTNPNVPQRATEPRCTTAYRTTPTALDSTECGYFYNWCAAVGTAFSNCSSYDGVTPPGAGVCPDGWRLPTGNSGGDITSLYPALGNTYANLVGPSSQWRGAYSGVFYSGAYLAEQSGYGFFWTSTPDYTTINPQYSKYTRAYTLEYSTTIVKTTDTDLVKDGFAIRCLAI